MTVTRCPTVAGWEIAQGVVFRRAFMFRPPTGPASSLDLTGFSARVELIPDGGVVRVFNLGAPTSVNTGEPPRMWTLEIDDSVTATYTESFGTWVFERTDPIGNVDRRVTGRYAIVRDVTP